MSVLVIADKKNNNLEIEKKERLISTSLPQKKNSLRELGKRGAKAGLHCYHSNAELQKHGAMVGGQCFHPSG